MSISVREALQIGGFSQCNLVAGADGLNKSIVYAGSMEIPDIKPWLIENQLLVTTGYAIKDEPNKITQLIQDLYDMKSSALAIKTKFTGSIPIEAIELANKLAIPLIEIPPEINFIDLLPMVIQAISVGHTRLIEFSKDIHDKFSELDKAGGGAQNIANAVANLLLSSVQITNAQFLPMCSCSKENIEPSQVFPLLLNECKQVMQDFSQSSHTRLFWRISSIELNYIVKKVILKEQIAGYIFICSKSYQNELTNIVIDHASAVMALEFSKTQHTKEKLRVIANNLYTDILSGTIKTEDEAVYRANNLNWTKPPLSLVVFDVNNFEHLAKSVDENQLQDIKSRIYEILNQYFFPNNPNPTIILKSDSFTCLVPNFTNKEQLASDIVKISEFINKELSINITAGISKPITRYKDIQLANFEARDAIKICRLDFPTRIYAFADDILIEQAFLHLKENPYIKEYLQNTIHKLVEYDEQNESELIHTLEVLVNCMGMRTKAAELLFLHRNTLMYRIKRIENITGCDLNDAQQIWALGMALRAKRFSGGYYNYTKTVVQPPVAPAITLLDTTEKYG